MSAKTVFGCETSIGHAADYITTFSTALDPEIEKI